MGKRKLTIYVDEEVLRATRVYAARADIRDSDVVESALRRYLGLELFERGLDLPEDEAFAVAYGELQAARAERDAPST